ncbi:PcfJ domain-containing protein [Sinorhizobium meliloti]|uniref:PcfJ domain-containing protein n=1 Tax=Rhizobium meliloti TaxID=382 RepID=UPI000FDB15A1|nr:PcfJ domain-containing protein [Sinorhizobium meliloti]RVI30874.1 hypothetical protein CN207_07475 [Sinorhizobium meliloti]
MDYNVYDDGFIKSYLTGFCETPVTAQLLTICLEKALRKGPEGLRPLSAVPQGAPGWLRDKFNAGVVFHEFASDAALDARVRHVADWIAASVANDEPWLKDVDAQGRPKKLMWIGTLAQAEAQADKAMRRFAFKAAAAPYIEGEGEETVMTFADGNRIVRLLTPAALDRESAMMGHCVGQGAYDASVQDRSRIIYSLRDGENQAHVTFEVKVAGNELVQCKGKANKPPVERYMPAVRAFIERSGFALKEAASMTGLVHDAEGKLHSILALPEGLRVPGNLDLSGATITTLPKGLSVGGFLALARSAITALPEGLSVGSYLYLRGTALRALPEGLRVGGSLMLNGVAITSLPKNLVVGGRVDLRGTAISVLPDGLRVGGSLDLSETAITALPKGLWVGSDLELGKTLIMALPEGLYVGGNLHLTGTRITELPEDLQVKGMVVNGLRQRPVRPSWGA